MSILTASDITIKYENYTAVLNVNFSIDSGDFLVVIGDNGSGKTTLIKGILGLQKLSNGSISTNNIGNIGYLPQINNIQNNFPASVYEIVMSGFINKIKLFYSKSQKMFADNILKKLSIYTIKNKSFKELSGGTKQRVLLARALCATLEVGKSGGLLILDEPFNGLDQTITIQLYDLLNQINKEDNITIIMISHDVKKSLEYSNKVLLMDKSIRYFGDTSTFDLNINKNY